MDEVKFHGTQIYLSPKDKETMFYLVEESAITDEEKSRLKSKLSSEYLNDRTMKVGLLAQKRNIKTRRLR